VYSVISNRISCAVFVIIRYVKARVIDKAKPLVKEERKAAGLDYQDGRAAEGSILAACSAFLFSWIEIE